MSAAKRYLENESYNTYGIEIEFGTHDSQMLSFTHIEVCYLYTFGVEKEKGWKIETDADYTLELVSPILRFNTQETARDFRDKLMQFLEKEVRTGIELGTLMQHLDDYIKTRFNINNGVWNYNAQGNSNLVLQTDWITNADLYNDLSWENWDEDTDLDQVLAGKKVIRQNAIDNVGTANALTATRMKNVIVTKSRKHGGLPSSQLNLPLGVSAFAYYETFFKRDKAWLRLFETETSTPRYIQQKIDDLKNAYPDLDQNNPVWKAKYLNDNYIESQIDEKTRFWHRYWLWLQTFYVCASYLSLENFDIADASRYAGEVDAIVDEPGYCSVEVAKNSMQALREKVDRFFRAVTYENNIISGILYLTVHKLVAGALSELSETLQMHAQEKIMDLYGTMTMEQIMDAIPNNQFMQFHYALKDLTSLWFKAPLFDVLAAESVMQANAVRTAKTAITNLTAEQLTNMIITIFTANFKLLGWYYSVCEANNQGFDYDWEEFCSYNMPGIPALEKSLLNSCTVLKQRLNNEDSAKKYLSTNSELPQRRVKFLKRTYLKEGNVYLTENDINIGYVAPWEGRWDTMKPVITNNDAYEYPQYPRYLVEHRNN